MSNKNVDVNNTNTELSTVHVHDIMSHFSLQIVLDISKSKLCLHFRLYNQFNSLTTLTFKDKWLKFKNSSMVECCINILIKLLLT